MKKIITGVKPTGESMHLGNLLGAVLPFKRASEGNDASIFIADLHALTSVKDAALLKKQSHELALEYFSIFGIDTPVRIFRQSDIHLVPKLNWILANVTPYSLMLRAHSFKDVKQRLDVLTRELWFHKGQYDILSGDNAANTDPKMIDMELRLKNQEEEIKQVLNDWEVNLNMGTFNYPILMAADIIGADIDMVPVGKDQIQHLEMTRDVARAFNKTYGEDIFKEPVAYVEKAVETLPGVDGRKMSKSYDNFIGVFDDEKQLKKRVMSIVTDSKGVEEPKDPSTCNVFALIAIFATPERREDIRAKYLAGGYGYGHAKLELLEILIEVLRPYREQRAELIAHPERIEERLIQGAKEMNLIWEKKMEEVKRVVGL